MSDDLKDIAKYLKPREMAAIYAACDDSIRNELIFMLMGKMGLRVAEVVGEKLEYWTLNGHRISNKRVPEHQGNPKLKFISSELPGVWLEDIDWDERKLNVRGKGSQTRRIPIHPEVFALLVEFVQPINKKPEELQGRLIRKNDNNDGISTDQVRNLANQYARKAGITRKVHPHLFRHGFAVDWLNTVKDIRALQIILGHSSLAITEKYLRLTDKSVQRLMDYKGLLDRKKEEGDDD